MSRNYCGIIYLPAGNEWGKGPASSSSTSAVFNYDYDYEDEDEDEDDWGRLAAHAPIRTDSSITRHIVATA